MNAFGLIVLTALFLDFSLNLIADLLDLKNLQTQPPEEARDIYDEEQYRKSQDYLSVNTRFGFAASTFGLCLTLAFWFLGGFNWLDNAVRSLEYGEIVNGLLFIGVLIFGQGLLNLPFSVYSIFVIEEKFGFNKMTPRTFVLDRLKTLLLALVLGAPLLAGVLAFFDFAGPMAWIYCWIAVTVYLLVVQFIAPTWIMPLFNKFTDLEDGELKSALLGYAKSVQFPLTRVFTIDGSKRSSKANAFFTGFGKNKRIALFDTLVEQHTVPELTSVLAHEIGHYKKKHIQQQMAIGILHTGLLFYLLSIFLNSRGLFDAFYMDQLSIYAGLIFFAMLFSPMELFLSIIMQYWSRKNEHEADRFAAETVEDPEEMIKALKKLSANNLANLTPHPFQVVLNHSHPPLMKRIEEIRKAAKNLPVSAQKLQTAGPGKGLDVSP